MKNLIVNADDLGWTEGVNRGIVEAHRRGLVTSTSLLANGQVRLSALQHQLTLEQSSHRQAELAVGELETPSRIVAAASGQLHMVRPAQVIELPYVSLSTPLPTPKVTRWALALEAENRKTARAMPSKPKNLRDRIFKNKNDRYRI